MRGKNVWAFIDVLFVLVFILLTIPHQIKANDDSRPPGQVIVEIRWPDGMNTDVDLWVEAPRGMSVGYSRRAGEFFNLLRDDLGAVRDMLELNYETAYTRGAPAGEYTVNLHLYSNSDQIYPVPVDVVVSVYTNESVGLILHKLVNLTYSGEEVTVARFTLDANGALVPGSIHNLPKVLRG
jgi:hypothetical protein